MSWSRADVVVRFQGGHNAGHTLVIDGADRRDRTVRRLAEHVSRSYRAPVNCNAYVS